MDMEGLLFAQATGLLMAGPGLEPSTDSIAHPLLTGPHSIPSISMWGRGLQAALPKALICANTETVLSLRQVLFAMMLAGSISIGYSSFREGNGKPTHYSCLEVP